MGIFDNQIMSLLSLDLFRQACMPTGDSSSGLTFYRYNALISYLTKCGIPYDATYNPGNRKDTPAVQLVIYINPNTKILLDFNFGSGESAYSSQ